MVRHDSTGSWANDFPPAGYVDHQWRRKEIEIVLFDATIGFPFGCACL